MKSLVLGLAAVVLDGGAVAAAPQRASPAKANLVSLFSNDDYPAEAIRNEEQGLVAYRITIDVDGRVTACKITSSSGSASLDAATCSIVQRRARFTPARDRQGRPTEDHYSGRIKWVLPEPDPTPFADNRQLAVFTTNAEGLVAACRLEGKSPPPAGVVCPKMMAVAQQVIDRNDQRGLLAGKELVLESGLLIGGPQAADFIGTGAGENRLNRTAFALTIDLAGKVVDCIVVSGEVDDQTEAGVCANDRRSGFAPLGPDVVNRSDRQAVRYLTAYTRPQR